MNYFVNQNLGMNLTGIEKAQLNRLALFKAGGMAAKIVTMGFNSRLHENARRFDVVGRCFSMYDYFQGVMDDETVTTFDWITYWEQTCGFTLKYIPKTQDVRVFAADGQFLMYARFYDQAYQSIEYLNYFDQRHLKIKRELFDWRGFRSQVIYLAAMQKVQAKVYLNRQGQACLEELYDSDQKLESTLRQIIVHGRDGRDYFFNTQAELQTFFFNTLYQDGDVYISDRNLKLAETLSKTNDAVKVCVVFHSTHAQSQTDVMGSRIKSHYRFMLEHIADFDRFICSTEYQKRDLLKRFPDLPVVAIPVGFTQPQVLVPEKRQPNRIIGVARYSPEKQVMHQAVAVSKLVGEFPDVQLHLFGYGSQEKALRDFIEEHHLEKNVFLRGFYPDLTEEYQMASLALLTSREEGFSLATLEAQNFGVPVISYDVRYGPSELIQDGENGFLVTANDQDELYEKIRDYLRQPELQEKFRRESLATAEKFSATAVTRKWQDLIRDVLAD
ncbi:poly(glycerol-phosphate) alpha-glucosyltransferase [Levilactobacillus koreensis JCM 16448]|uniref:Glycosyl transferase family 1 domain-containing protein n=1 Tax=Levilactobacillus koreensis TaxID=637971 RepID=A0AAC8ZGZ1_9LACO|nr:glycosyltransferase [Levilactobacillus koreensis]AKP65503.1 hypothetical protein ABN16_11210 [Levilactobacillus koreensis]KRK87456.1 poly(glycerol-phosphate) alpha-glucosyltransferase [Levilactobacillus koreensis JCM 16448]